MVGWLSVVHGLSGCGGATELSVGYCDFAEVSAAANGREGVLLVLLTMVDATLTPVPERVM